METRFSTWIVLILTTGLIGLTACKPSGTQSDIQSIDNFARTSGAAKLNLCAGTHRDFAVEPLLQMTPQVTKDKKLADVVVQATGAALSSVPESVRAQFFGHKGIIRVGKDVSKICREKLNSATDLLYASEGGKLEACWDVEEGGDFRIYLEADPKAIQHHLVRMFARVVSEVITNIPEALSADQKKEMSDAIRGIERFKTMREQLRRTFVAESKASPKLDVSKYDALLKTANGTKTFGHFVFAESFDSYHCSAATRATFKQIAPKTYAAFERINSKFFAKDAGFVDRLAAGFHHAPSPYAKSKGQALTKGFGLGWFDWLWSPENTGGNTSYYDKGTSGYQRHQAYEQRSQAERRAAVERQNRELEPKIQNIQNAGNNPVVRATAAGLDIASGGVGSELVKTYESASEAADRRNEAFSEIANGNATSENIQAYQEASQQTVARGGVGAANTAGAAYKKAAGAIDGNLGKGISYATEPGKQFQKDFVPGAEQVYQAQEYYDNGKKVIDAAFGSESSGSSSPDVSSVPSAPSGGDDLGMGL